MLIMCSQSYLTHINIKRGQEMPVRSGYNKPHIAFIYNDDERTKRQLATFSS